MNNDESQSHINESQVTLSLKQNDIKTINILTEMLKEKDDLSKETIFQQPETFTIIKMILTKYQKDKNDVYILSHYLKTLKNFMNSILQGQHEDFDYMPLLNKISLDLKSEEYEKNTFMMRVGDIGKKFYVIISGSVSILVPKVMNVFMTKQQYVLHLELLNSLDEKYLLEKTFKNNESVFTDFKIEDYEKLLKKKNKKKINVDVEDEESKGKISLNKYLYFINAEYIYQEKYGYKEVKIVGYFKVTELNQGSSFGEYALINDNQQRTASIFIKEDCFFGILSSSSYKKCLQNIQENNKKKDVEFVFTFKIFNDIPVFFFSQNYWNYFIRRKIHKNDYLFKQGQERDEIYFLQEGEFLINTKNLTFKKVNLFLSQLGHIHFPKTDYEDIGRGLDISLTFSKKGDILGMEDLLYNNNFFCSAICISKYASFFAININIFKNMCSHYPKVLERLKKMETDKKILMIQKLQNIKISGKKTLSGEFRKDDENNVFWEQQCEIKNPILKKNYSRMKSFKTLLKSFELNSYIKKMNNNYDKDNSNDSNIFITINKKNSSRKYLPSLNYPISLNRNRINSSRNNNDKYIFDENNDNSINKSLRKIPIIRLKKDKSISELKRNILKNNRQDFISKILLGKSVENYDKNNDDYYFLNVENNYIKSSINSKRKETNIRESILMKDLTGIESYNDKKHRLINSLKKH